MYYNIELINEKTKETILYEDVQDLNEGEKMYFNFQINAQELKDGEYKLNVIDGDGNVVASDTLNVGEFDIVGIQHKRGENVYINTVLDAKTEANDVEIMSQGSGLGLSIVKSIVDLMDGTISVHSEKGKGTSIVVHLDLPILEQQQQDIYLSPEEILKGKKVLLIEDHPMNIEIIKELLEKKGISVICATNGKEGLETFENSKENEIDLILTDIRMPVMDGQEMSKQIRALNRNDSTTVSIVAITANILEEDILIYHKSGINDFVEKPIKPDVLYKVLRKQLG